MPRRIDRFEIRERMGEGAFGVVYRAFDPKLDREVALKVAKPDSLKTPERLSRFEGEARSAAQLRHPHIVPVFETGRDGARSWIAHAFIRGRTLEDRIEEARGSGGLDVSWCVRIVRQVAEALAYAHGEGVVHRDVKPSNVMLDEKGQPLLADFGLAGRVATQDGGRAGTPPYMAPEAWDGRATTASDQYALGVMLYEMLAGETPFAGPAELLEFLHRSQEPPPLLKSSRRVSRDLEAICRKCLHKESAKRYASCGELADDLRRCLDREPVRARSVSLAERAVKWGKRNPIVAWLLATVAFTLVLGASVALGFALVARANETWALSEKGKAERALKKAKEEEAAKTEQLKLKEHNLLTAQLQRVAAIYQQDPMTARSFLYDPEACPIEVRDSAWRFYERACSQWERDILIGHTHVVYAVAFSPDGRLLATGSKDSTARLWDATTGQPVQLLAGHTDEVHAVAFSPDGQLLATSSTDGRVLLWDVASGRQQRELKGHAGEVYAVAFSPDGLTLAGGSLAYDSQGEQLPGGVRLWDVKTGQLRVTLQGHTSGVWAIAFSPDGHTLASVSGKKGKTGEVQLWDMKTGERSASLPGHTDLVISVAFSPDGQTLATGSWDDTVRLWDVRRTEPKATLRHTDTVTSVAFSPDGLTLATSARDHAIRIWDLTTGQEQVRLTGHTFIIHEVAFSPDGLTLASCAGDCTARLWDVQPSQGGVVLRGHTLSVGGLAFHPDGQILVSGSYDETVRLRDVKTGKVLRTLRDPQGSVHSMALSPDGLALATGTRTPVVRLWNLNTGQVTDTLQGPADVRSLAYSPDGLTLATGSGGTDPQGEALPGEVRLWDTRTGQHKATFTGHASSVETVAFSPDGETLVSGSTDHTVKLWDVRAGGEILTLRGHSNDITSLAFSPDGRALASASQDGTVRVWDVTTGQATIALMGHTEGIQSVAFSPDGKTLATGSHDNTARLWDRVTGQERVVLPGHTSTVYSVAFSPDGQTLASGSHDGTVHLFDLRFGLQQRVLQGHSNKIECVALSPDGGTLATGSYDRTVRLWDVKSGRPKFTLSAHTDRVTSVTFSPDGLTLASGSLDQSVRLWDIKAGRELAALRGHSAGVSSLAFSLDGQTLHSRDYSESSNAWDVRTFVAVDSAHTLLPGTVGVRPFHPTASNGRVKAVAQERGLVLFDAAAAERERFAGSGLEHLRRIQWHFDRAERGEASDDWFAAAFHLRQLSGLRPNDVSVEKRLSKAWSLSGQWSPLIAHQEKRWEADPGDATLGFGLAVARLSQGDHAGYRNTCQRLLALVSLPTEASWVGSMLAPPPGDVGSLALRLRTTEPPPPQSPRVRINEPASPQLKNIHLTVRACTLRPDSLPDPSRLLSLSAGMDVTFQGAILCRLGRYEDACQTLSKKDTPLARLHLAWAEQGRGNSVTARQLLEKADAADSSKWSWDDRQAFSLLRQEVEGRLTPLSMEKLP